MKARIEGQETRELVAVVTKDGEVVMRTGTPRNITDGYPCHVVGDRVSLTTGDLDYWASLTGSTPVYRGQRIIMEF